MTIRRPLLIGLAALTLPAFASDSSPSQSRISLPLVFIPNQGQSSPETEFMVRNGDLAVHFRRHSTIFSVQGASIESEFVGATGPKTIEGLGPVAGTMNFLVGEPTNWRTEVPVYSGLIYRDLYPGIDLVYKAYGSQLKSEFRVAPGADAGEIRLRYTRDARLTVDSEGALSVRSGVAVVRDTELLIYQEHDRKHVEIAGKFQVNGDTVSFSLGGYDRSLPLTIDPVVYATWLGGSAQNAALSLAVDASGAVYIAGYTSSFDLPTVNPEQTVNVGGNDIFVAKLNPAGNALEFCTYIGGRGDDRAYGIAVDASGSVYVTGSTTSVNFPTRVPLQTQLAGYMNAFLLKLNATGNALVYSTYLGGNGSDIANGIALDSIGNAYIGGQTKSSNFPASGYQKTSRGAAEGFVAKVSADGSRLLYSTYLGGSGDDSVTAMAVGSDGSAYVTGSTFSQDFPVANAYQGRSGGAQDAFLARLDSVGGSLIFGTYFGGSSGTVGAPEAGMGVTLDSLGNVYIAGVTSSTDFPVLNAAQPANAGWQDGFAAKFTPLGALIYSTYIGGVNIDIANAIAVDAAGNAYIAGATTSRTLVSLVGSTATPTGDYDAFVAVLNPSGTAALGLTLVGDSGSNSANAIAVDASSNVWVAGTTISEDFPVTGGLPSVNIGSYGAFVVKLASLSGISVSLTPTVSMLYPGQTLQLSATVSNAANTAVNWSLSPSGFGSITPGGLYTAPPSISGSQAVTITALSASDNSKFASSTVLLEPSLYTGNFAGQTLGAWMPFGAASVSFAFLGSIAAYSLYLSGGSGGVFQDFSGLQAGQWYTVTARVQSAPGTTGNAALYLHDTTGFNTVFSSRLADTSGWDTLEAQFLATSTERARIHVEFLGGVGGVYFDRIQLIQGWHTGFEGGLTVWNGIGSAFSVTSVAAFEGTSSLVEYASGGVYRDITGMTPGQIYHVAVRAHSSGGSSQATLWVHDSTGARAVSGGTLTPSSTGWDLLEADFVTGPNGTLRLHLLDSGGTGAIYWDDVQVTMGGCSDFETGNLANWAIVGAVNASVNSVMPFSGMYNLTLSGGPGLVFRDLTGLDPGTQYRIAVHVRSSSAGAGTVMLWVHDTANADAVQYGPQLASSSQWQTYTVNFLSTSTQAARIHLIYGGGSGAAYLDDVTVEKGWESNFEIGLTGWNGFGSTMSSLTTALAYSGSSAVIQSGGPGGLYQDVTGLTPGQYYRVTAQARTAAGSPVALLWVHDTLGGNSIQDGPRTPSAVAWNEFGVTFTADATGTARVHLYDFGGTGQVYWDQVDVTPVMR